MGVLSALWTWIPLIEIRGILLSPLVPIQLQMWKVRVVLVNWLIIFVKASFSDSEWDLVLNTVWLLWWEKQKQSHWNHLRFCCQSFGLNLLIYFLDHFCYWETVIICMKMTQVTWLSEDTYSGKYKCRIQT